jgi:hypothetical protein
MKKLLIISFWIGIVADAMATMASVVIGGEEKIWFANIELQCHLEPYSSSCGW